MLENIDCLAHMLSYLTVRERESCRAVCLNWLLSADELARTQQTLVIVGQQREHAGSTVANNNTTESLPGRRGFRQIIRWPHSYIRYHCFCQMLGRFPNVQAITFEGIEHWNDHLLHQLAAACPRLTRLDFFSCVGIGRSRLHEKDYLNVTVRGWSRLIDHFGRQLTQLTLSDCDLDDDQLAIVVGGFRSLLYLDLSSNRLGEARPLRDLPPGLRVLKVGPRLGAGREVRELHLQGFLCRQLERLAEMRALERLTIRFMKPLFEDAAVVAALPPLAACPPQHPRLLHGPLREHLSAIFSGCPLLSRLVLNCDIWCDSPVDDQLLGDLRRCCPLLEHLDLCPGNYQTTDACLAVMATFPRLRTLRLVEFSGITEAGLMAAIRWLISSSRTSSSSQQQQLVSFTVEDCCDIDVQRVMDGLRRLHAEHPHHRRLELAVTPLRSLQVPTQVHCIPDERRPVIRLTVCGQKEGVGGSNLLNRGSSIQASLAGYYRHLIDQGPWVGKFRLGREHYSELMASASSLLRFIAQSALSAITFLSTLLTFGAACCVYLLHLVLLNVHSGTPPPSHPVHLLLGISFLSPGTIFCLSALFIGPVLYVVSSLLQLLTFSFTASGV
ncbi:hypothetical protein TYRP_006092 [Tyrophagus putrescentiae]|nr:hypothetical protein TYRP_006092 [Tyrophagus putrescentiae]